MYTVCPKCTLALAVTAADLRAGQGYVRCGRCANVFNALLALQDETETSPGLPIGPVVLPEPEANAAPEPPPILAFEDPPARAAEPRVEYEAEPAAAPALAAPTPAAPTAAAPTAAAPTAAAAAEAPLPNLALPVIEFVEAEETFTEILPEDLAPRPLEQPRRLADAQADEAIGDTTEVEEFRGTGTYETIVLEGEGYLQTEELLSDETIDAEIAAVSRQLAAAHGGSAEGAASEPPERRAPQRPPLWAASLAIEPEAQAGGEDQAVAAAIAEAVARLGPAIEPARRPRWGMPAALLLALLLGVQALHHWRNQLATQPALNAPLTRLYAALGQPLTPEWDLAAYDVRQLGASADSADNRAIHVRLSLASRARVPQGLPLVRLTLIDRYGKALGAGELAPAQYLPPAQRGLRLIAPDQRIDTDVSVLDASQQASSFELDVCLPRPGGGLRCAAEAALAGNHS
jgi:predicted Zn finger-like uncharacterized protein